MQATINRCKQEKGFYIEIWEISLLYNYALYILYIEIDERKKERKKE